MPHSRATTAPDDQTFMQMALRLGAEAAAAGEVPVGAVVVKDGVVIGSGCNSPIQSCDPTAHAEVQALRTAARTLGNYRLDDCTLYVTLEPCAMCCGAALHSRLKRVVFGAAEPKTGCAGSVQNLFANAQLNHQTQVEGGLLAQQASLQLQTFFKDKRAQQRQDAAPLREDALRTPEHCFGALVDYPWAPHYVSDLPSLAGLRLHYLDLGRADSPQVYLCLHPIPGWSFSWRARIAVWLEQGVRVVAPDLIGFGKSDKPKRADFHQPDWHLRCLQELLERLDLRNLVVLLPDATHPLLQGLAAAVAKAEPGRRLRRLQLEAIEPAEAHTQAQAQERVGRMAPYPNAGYRAGERALAPKTSRAAKMKS
jgi:tRNA(adenine34) deaminase